MHMQFYVSTEFVKKMETIQGGTPNKDLRYTLMVLFWFCLILYS